MRVSSIAFIIAFALPFAHSTVAAEIPHENYDLMDSDLGIVVAMLNASIRASEESLRCFDGEDVQAANAYLDMVASVLGPVEAALDDIEDYADSYYIISALIPPFVDLQSSMTEFCDLESQLIDLRDEIAEYASLTDLTDTETVATLESMLMVNSLLARMNTTIDIMLIDAEDIDALTVDDWKPFVPNELVELIEALRSLTLRLHQEISALVEEEVPWEDDRSFLLVWVEDSEVYLGEDIRGGGYLMVNGTFVALNDLNISIDGVVVISTVTTAAGSFTFNYSVPLNASWLGTHDLVAMAAVSNMTLISDIVMTVSLFPTTIVLSVDEPVMSHSEEVTLSAMLAKLHYLPLPNAECVLSVDGEEQGFVTDMDGFAEWTWTGSSLGYGVHEFVARYPGELPNAPCYSNTVIVTVDIPTEVELLLSDDQLMPGEQLEGVCSLRANGTTPLPSRTISFFVDDTPLANLTTDGNGESSFVFNMTDMEPGSHVLSAKFADTDDLWRGSEDETTFILVDTSESEHPFFPWIPGWDIGGDLLDQIRNLFFGEYAFLTWLFVILVVTVVIRAIQSRKRKRSAELPPEEKAVDSGKPWSATLPWLARETVRTEQMPSWLTNPNEKIIWYYHSLLTYLKSRARVGISDNMTHWEVAHLLETVGYPPGEASRLVSLYEKAQYSGTSSSEREVDLMKSSADALRSSGGARPAV